jgi:hypothetical protein
MSTGHGCNSPGKSHCQLNYSLQEQVVNVYVQDKVGVYVVLEAHTAAKVL